MFCNKCGSQVNPGDNICSNCGSPLETSYSAQNYQTQNNYQQTNYTQNNNGYNPLSGIISNKANIGWIFVIVALLCSLGNLFMSMVSFKISEGSMSIGFDFSFLQLSSLASTSSRLMSELTEELELGRGALSGGSSASFVFIWIFTIISIALILISIYMILKDKTDKSFLLSVISLVSATIAKLIQIFKILGIKSDIKDAMRYYDDDDFSLSYINDIINIPFSSWLMLILIIVAIVLIFLYAKKNNITIIPKRANTYNPYQYQNAYQNPYQNPNQNYTQYPNNNNYQNNDQNNNQS